MRSAFLAFALSSFALVACAQPTIGEDFASGEDALTGNVTVGRTVQTQADGLRLRKTPSKESQKNVIGLLPTGTTVKILESAPTDGFYKVEVMDDGMRERLLVDTGWVWGEHLTGEAEELVAQQSSEPTLVFPKPRFVDCHGMVDDRGEPMVNLETPMGGEPGFASIAFNSEEFPYGSEASVKQIDLQSHYNPGGTPIRFKVVRTAPKIITTPLEVTICTRDVVVSSQVLPDKMFGLVDVTVSPPR